MTKRSKIAVLAGATGLSLLAGGARLAFGGGDRGTDIAGTVIVEERDFTTTVSAIGAVKPQIGAEVRVGSRISGRVQRLRANIGDRVERGQVIAELETEELDALIAERRAEFEMAEAKLAAVQSLSPFEIAQAEADVDGFEATAKLASEAWERQQVLLREGFISPAEAEAAYERHEVSRAQLESALRAVQLVRTGTDEQLRQAEADVERVGASLQRARVDRSFTVILSPIAGVVASVSTQEGETVAAGLSAPTFVTVVDLKRLQVDAYVDEVDIGKVSIGQSVLFTVDAFPARDFEGHVSAIYPSATIQDNVVKYVVAVDIDGEYAGLLRPEMTASVGIRMEARTALTVPTRAIRRRDGGSVVYLLQSGEAHVIAIRLGWRDGPWAEVVEGLAEGDHILLDPPTPGVEENR